MSLFFFFNDTATTEIYTLSLHDALPILVRQQIEVVAVNIKSGHVIIDIAEPLPGYCDVDDDVDRKSTRLNSSHQIISYAVFCLKKKKTATESHHRLSPEPREQAHE